MTHLARAGSATSAVELDLDLAARLRLTIGRLWRQVRQESTGGLTLTQLSTLSSVNELGPLRIGELAQHEQVALPTMTRLLAALEAAGYVVRAGDPADRRSTRVSTTSAGSQVLARVRADRTAILARRLAALSAQEREDLHALVPSLEKLIR